MRNWFWNRRQFSLFYRDAAHVTAVEPNPLIHARGAERLRKASVPIDVVEAIAEVLPFEDNAFDTVIATLVFCTIPDPPTALAEIQRVSKPNAEILFFEHVRMEQPVLGKTQDLLNPLWNKICDGCHLNRDTMSIIQQSRLDVVEVKQLYNKLFLSIRCKNNKRTIERSVF
ncbi:class I SAM-dependent methyltransferase [Sporosarcina oncorhynchi]|uniref:Class I SAM-dependent methyltransferase n=1 Tax=Sporosarcina oncorhynchi TaxID=3056444 RepID=A0ABZ0LAN6_9BACL|nr:class I SAM-dependent methyltransferase [Sporosarcina sp. T2O-4]WOV89249.1 class I SAM-dependent methyltransferase [Sporosarcina sp. T2O-4]